MPGISDASERLSGQRVFKESETVISPALLESADAYQMPGSSFSLGGR
jgi:hypothetical protein